jgi:hypothetical protein
MSGKLDEFRKRAEAAARELNEKYEIKTKLSQGVRVAGDTIRKGAQTASSALDSAVEEAARINRESKITETVTDTARKAAGAADEAYTNTGAKEKVNQAASAAKEKATDFFGGARRYYDIAAGAARAGTSAAVLPSSIIMAINRAHEWTKKNPGKAAVVSLAFSLGARAGAAFSSMDTVLLGAGGAGNWIFHSAVIPYGLRKLSERYEDYLKNQEELLKDGKLDESDRSRIKFQHDVAKYVGAPLLGAFSVAAGGGLVYEAFTGGIVAGAPINLVIGANPMLSSIWLFGNGLVCFHNGYKFFMMALAGQEDVARVVRDIKGLLPAVS